MQAIKDLSRALEKFGITGLRARADGRFSLSHDGGRRLDIHALADGRLVMEVHVAYLPELESERSEVLKRALRFSAACMLKRHDVLCLSPDAGHLLLQCDVPARSGTAAVETALEQFLNAAEAWHIAMGQERRYGARRSTPENHRRVFQP